MADKLTILAARTLSQGRVLKCDSIRGLELHGRAGGRRVWMFYYRAADGSQRRPKIGEFPALGIDAAREAARGLAAAIALGSDPSAERQALRAAPTMADLFRRYDAEHAAKKKEPQSREQDQRNWRLHVAPRVGKIKAAAFSLADARRVLEAVAVPKWEIAELARPLPDGRTHRKRQIGGPVVANRVRALLSGMLRFAEHSEVRIRPKGSNFVMDETDLNRERPRKRYVRRDEFPRIWEALAAVAVDRPRECAALWASLYTGTRVSELLSARREWLDGVTLALPDHKTDKHTGADRIVTLPRQALDLIAGLPNDGSGRLFGRGLDRFRIHDTWELIRERAGCPDVQARDIRRTFASVGRTTGLGLDQVADLLGHSGNEKVTAGYAYIFEEDRAKMVQSIADRMDAMSEGTTE